eukprot:NODE_3048_length_838_cov_249.355045.p2 GENE.NODE_3048_length_838_cov_249.355045~~NODE_3048_length_838_cov_249.355045.p2  ORF type:complete len:245 (+),score=82.50 NODE_3048_length_838_cov_249.355045:91-735(+)
MLATSILEVVGVYVVNPHDLVSDALTLEALFKLLAEAVRASPPGMTGLGICCDKLRALLFQQPPFIGRCVAVVGASVQECTSPKAVEHMLRFLASLMEGDEALALPAHRAMLVAALPEICVALCCALASQKHLTELEALDAWATVLERAGSWLPAEFPAAFAVGLVSTQVADCGRAQLEQHVAARTEWSHREEWLEQLQRIVVTWQSERVSALA